MNKKALITGITGQDGSYLAELLLSKGYEVYGIIRRSSSINNQRISHLFKEIHDKESKFHLVYGDLSDSSALSKIINNILPDEIYNLGAQSHVRVSFDVPEYTSDVVAIGVVRILEVIRSIKEEKGKSIKFYQASSSEMFGEVQEIPQKETTPFYPRSPYGCAKVYGYGITRNYRESYNIFACNGILFNHESPRRGETFVTKKITQAIAKIKEGVQDCLYLGNLDAKRDWGHARDYVEAMWLMLQQEKPDDYVVATNETHSVREFLELAFEYAGIAIKSNGKEGVNEEYVRIDTNQVVVKIDPRYFRPTEVDLLIGDYSKAKRILGWEPKILFSELAKEMIMHDIAVLKTELYGSKADTKEKITTHVTTVKSEVTKTFPKISLIKSSFYDEKNTKLKIVDFVLTTDKFSMDKKCLEFENKFSEYQGRKYSVFFNSGSSANLALMQAIVNLKLVKEKDNVGFSAITWATNLMPIIQNKLTPIPIDVSLETLNSDLTHIKKTHSEHKLKALFITNLLGFCSELDKIEQYCKENNIILLEDNCESLGSELQNKKLGNFGLASTFSFFVGHHISTIEGGMVCTDDKELYDMLKMVRAHGWSRNVDDKKKQELKLSSKVDDFHDMYTFYYLGYNLRPTEINGIIGIEQVKHIPEIILKRNQNYLKFKQVANNNTDFTKLNTEHMSFVSNFAYPLICKDEATFNKYRKLFSEHNVEIRPIVGGSMTEQPFAKEFFNSKEFNCPNAKTIHQLGFYFPNNPEMTETEINLINSLLKK